MTTEKLDITTASEEEILESLKEDSPSIQRNPYSKLTAADGVKFQRDVGRYWLMGWSIPKMANHFQTTNVTINSILRLIRGQLRLLNTATIEERAAKAIEVYRMVQTIAHEYIEKGVNIPKYLHIVMKAEEAQAKIQGIWLNKVQINSRVDIYKHYDFDASGILNHGQPDELEAPNEEALQIIDVQLLNPEKVNEAASANKEIQHAMDMQFANIDPITELPDEAFPAIEDHEEFTRLRRAMRPKSHRPTKAKIYNANQIIDENGDILEFEE